MPPIRQRPGREPADADRAPWRVEGHPDTPGEGTPPRRTMLPQAGRRFWGIFLALLALNFLVSIALSGKAERLSVPYTIFYQEVQQGNVREISSKGDEIQGSFRTAVRYPPGKAGKTNKKFDTVRPRLG